jgi:hypothetical protein
MFVVKGAGKGTGLGLSLVHGIVADLGGGIDVSTAVGCGTTFTSALPIPNVDLTDPYIRRDFCIAWATIDPAFPVGRASRFQP